MHGVIHTSIVCVYEFRRGFCTSVLSLFVVFRVSALRGVCVFDTVQLASVYAFLTYLHLYIHIGQFLRGNLINTTHTHTVSGTAWHR